jgi:hypothetical protein
MSTIDQKQNKKSKKVVDAMEPIKQSEPITEVKESPKKSKAKKVPIDTVEEPEVTETKPKSRAKKSEAKEAAVEPEVTETKPKSRAKKSEAKEAAVEPEVTETKSKSRAKKSEAKVEPEAAVEPEVTETKSKSRAKKSEAKVEEPEVTETKPKSRAKKSEAKEAAVEPEVTETKPKSRAKKSEAKVEPEVTEQKTVQSDNKDIITQAEIDSILENAKKCKEDVLSKYETIINLFRDTMKHVRSIDIVRHNMNDVYQNLFDILATSNLMVNQVHNINISFVMATNAKSTKEQYFDITKECCGNIDKLRDTYIVSADQHNESLTKLYIQLNEFLEKLQNPNSFKLDKTVKSVINSDSENSDTGSDKLDIGKLAKPGKSLKLEKSIIKADSDDDSD